MSEFKNAIVITGVIGSGKSTVVNLLRVYGFSIIDADEIAHKVLDESSSIIASKFGSEFVSDNRVDRKSLGKLIFSDSKAKKELENILHDRIKEQIFSKANKLESSNYPYFIDLPLYFEKSPVYDEFQSVCVVYAPEQICLKRIMLRDGISLNEAKARLNSQISIDEKLRLANFVIDNSSDMKHLNLQIDKFISALKSRYKTLNI
ncbi:dephospho-CoA kinase [Campylobacter porcelli]|uniref:Dephospho-CoA kinase n=1 Tax=Campylobacter porcelli TaxID=1660073 RepID=A0A1X9SUB5_9BACT|nr:dephospho-CoA kinase [Campylobacter sp. RM6137]ARQ99889.1 dephospho-CoA kinase [Campylobacter sp. RM6137]